MIMLPWRASGVRSKMSLSTTVATRRENKLSGRSPSTSRYSTIGKDGKHGWGTYPRLTMNGSSMQGRVQHERKFGVHYCHQGSVLQGPNEPFNSTFGFRGECRDGLNAQGLKRQTHLSRFLTTRQLLF